MRIVSIGIGLAGTGGDASRLLFKITHAACLRVAVFITSFFLVHFPSSVVYILEFFSAPDLYKLWTGLSVLVTPTVLLGRRLRLSR